MSSWSEVLRIDARRRDREIVTARLLRPVLDGQDPDWRQVPEPELRRRAAYLVDLVQHSRGQTDEEAQELAAIRAALGPLEPCPFWPGERPLPPGTDPIAERWGYTRGIDLARLRAALNRPVELLPDAS
jgi:hypothetical protein